MASIALAALTLGALAAAGLVDSPARGALTSSTADGGSGTYTAAGNTLVIQALNGGTTTWRFVVFGLPAGAVFTGGSGGGGCQVGQFVESNRELECLVEVPTNGRVAVTATFNGNLPCGTALAFWVNSTGTPPYTRVNDVVYQGTCAPTKFNLKTTAQGQGKVTSEPDGAIDCPPKCDAQYDAGTKVGLRATADAGWEFDHWENDCSGNVKTCTVTMDKDRNVVAVFKKKLGACKCVEIDTATTGAADFGANDVGATGFSFAVKWTMYCDGARGACSGQIVVNAPAGTDLQITNPNPTTVDCNGTCGRAGIGVSRGSFTVRGTSAKDLGKDARVGKSFTFTFTYFCIQNGKRVAAGTGSMTITYDGKGNLDGKNSDLNGNGVKDRNDPPPPRACRCSNLGARIVIENSFASAVVNLRIEWTLTCVGTGLGCKGEIQELGAVRAATGTNNWQPSDVALGVVGYPRGSRPVIQCAGKCSGVPTKGTIHAVGRSNTELQQRARRGTTLRIFLRTRCANGVWNIRAYDIVFNARGAYDKSASRLGGNPPIARVP